MTSRRARSRSFAVADCIDFTGRLWLATAAVAWLLWLVPLVVVVWAK